MNSKFTVAISVLIALSISITPGMFADNKPDSTKNQQAVNAHQGMELNQQVLYLDDLGIDLVVSRIEISRIDYQGTPHIMIKPYIKNMCNGFTGKRIKVWYDGLSYATWIEGGIGAKEEKAAPAKYYADNTDRNLTVGTFHIEVDNNNEIKENVDTNNRCGPVNLLATETSKTHRCPINYYRCIKRPDIKKYQMKDPIRH
jgi:hypothetical protein